MIIAEAIQQIIKNSYERDLTDEELDAVKRQILSLGEWGQVRAGLLAVLYENDTELWNEAIVYMYYFQGMGHTYEPVETIALLYNCLSLSDTLDSNLVWTITRTIKSIPYDSDYDPYNDPAMYREMGAIDKKRLLRQK